MSEETKQRLKNTPVRRCSICNTPYSYGNPIAKCWECKRDFCFDHIFGSQVNNQMEENDPLRNICDKCRKLYRYRTY